jgi:hypothetical protein
MTPATAQSTKRISEIPGAALQLEECLWPEGEREANFSFWIFLGELTGRLGRSLGATYSERGSAETWLTLADVDEAALRSVLGRMRRLYGHWTLDSGNAESLLGQIDAHYHAAQVRRREQ